MRHSLKALAGSSLLLLGMTANAQQYPPRYENRYQDRYQENRYQERDERDDYYGRGRFFDRLRADLDRAEAAALPFTGDRTRIERAKQELAELRQSLDDGNYYNRRPLDDAVRALQTVLDSNAMMSGRNRDVLANDLSRLRDWQARYDYGR
jgi:hypothetical protein